MVFSAGCPEHATRDSDEAGGMIIGIDLGTTNSLVSVFT